MFPLTSGDLHALLNPAGAQILPAGMAITGITIDSRRVRPGNLFIALRGSKTHGAQFSAAALTAGATAIVSDEAAPSAIPADRWLQVTCPVRALQTLGAWNRRQSDALVMAVTGSVGKTTTRQLIAHVLNGLCPGLQSEANFNNHLGVPLTLAQLDESHAWAVVELGASATGEIRALAELTMPDISIVTTVAPAHLSSFGSLDAIQRTKQELVETTAADGTVFLNGDDPRVAVMARATPARVVTFGETDSADIKACNVRSAADRLSFSADGSDFVLRVTGRRMLVSALAALAVAREVGMPDHETAVRLASFKPDAGRGRVIQQCGVTVIDDTYNASPLSVSGAIDAIDGWNPHGRRLLVLGDMLELGDESDAAHTAVGERLALSRVDHCFVYGDFADLVGRAALRGGMSPGRISVLSEFATLQALIDCIINPGDVILLKASRGMALDRLIGSLAARETSGGGPDRRAA